MATAVTDYETIFSAIYQKLVKMKDPGKVATYIPELGKIDPKKFGVHLATVDARHFSFGDAHERFSIQSISKVLGLTMAYNLENENLWQRVGVEPSGSPFNSLVQLEADKGIPRNPLINAGALVVSDILLGHLKNPKREFIEFVRDLAGNSKINYSARIVASEKSMGFKNAALINLMKSFGNIQHDIDTVLDFYFSLCSIEMSCKEIAETFLYLASAGEDPDSRIRVLTPSKAKRINAIMQLCGFYDEAGEFAFKVGLPGKSGVGGGIVAIHPNRFSIAIWSPRLNKKGNSFKGMKFLEMLTSKTRASIF